MSKITFSIAGMGNRGTTYMTQIMNFPAEAEVVAAADPRPDRLDLARKALWLPDKALFPNIEEMLKEPKLSDVMIISTQDAFHKNHAIAALEKGYDLILEKPIATTMADCEEIAAAADRLGRLVLVCHVLRYTPFYRTIKNLIRDGRIGKVESINATEGVGYYHIAHSYVRGNWHKESTSCPMILAKSCHDMDLMVWLTDRHCRKVSSFGSLDYFKAENAPKESAERCVDCKVDCPFNAVKFYLSRIPRWPASVLQANPTEENIMESLRTTDYGKCVFKMDNDVVDHQIVNLLLEDNITVGFQMIGFTATGDRSIRIMGTEGEIYGNVSTNQIHVHRFREEPEVIDVTSMSKSFKGHNGGDAGLIADAIRYFRNDDFDRTSITKLSESLESHRIAFAAEASRLREGEVVSMDGYTGVL